MKLFKVLLVCTALALSACGSKKDDKDGSAGGSGGGGEKPKDPPGKVTISNTASGTFKLIAQEANSNVFTVTDGAGVTTAEKQPKEGEVPQCGAMLPIKDAKVEVSAQEKSAKIENKSRNMLLPLVLDGEKAKIPDDIDPNNKVLLLATILSSNKWVMMSPENSPIKATAKVAFEMHTLAENSQSNGDKTPPKKEEKKGDDDGKGDTSIPKLKDIVLEAVVTMNCSQQIEKKAEKEKE